MAQPAPELSAVTRTYDAKTRVVLERTAKTIRARIRRMGSGFSKDIRKAQLALVLNQIDAMLGGMWTGPMLDIAHAGGKAGAKAAEDAIETLMRPMYAALPDDVADVLADGLALTANNQIERAFARVPRSLSAAVYRNAGKDQKKVHDLIESGLASGLNAREMAADVYKYVSPTTPGGASYAAMRLSRTEINNAFHNQQRDGAHRIGVKNAIWNLSGSHKVPDDCNAFATIRTYPADSIPDKPHPQCFCYLTYDTMSSDEFRDALSAGTFDDELDRRTKANIARAGGVEPAPDRAPKLVAKQRREPEPVPKIEPKRGPLTGEDAQAIVPKGLFKPGTLNAKQTKALKTYETGAFREMNRVARSQQPPADRDDERTLANIHLIDGAMAESLLSEDIQVWRGMYRSRSLFGDRLDNDMTGVSWDDHGFGSTTSKESVANDFAPRGAHLSPDRDSVKMTVVVPRGTGVLQTSTHTEGSSFNGPQGELTLQRGMTWRVVKDNGYDADGVRQLDVEVTRIVDRTPAGGGTSDGGTSTDQNRGNAPGPTHPIPNNNALTRSIRSGEASSDKLSGGAIAETTKVQFKDGTAGVRKRTSWKMSKEDREAFEEDNPGGLDEFHGPKKQQDAEELAAMLARMMGLKAPQVVREDDHTTLQQFLPGTVASAISFSKRNVEGKQIGIHTPTSRVKQWTDSDQGWLVGLLDQVVSNEDRNDGNWLTDGDDVVVIDHGLAWSNRRGDGGIPDLTKPFIYKGKDGFSRKFTTPSGARKNVDIHPDDLDVMLDLLTAMKPEFVKRGQLQWWEFSMMQVEAMRPNAKGKKRRLS
jgi:hypothetical protein